MSEKIKIVPKLINCSGCGKSFPYYLGATSYMAICPYCAICHTTYLPTVLTTSDKSEKFEGQPHIPIGSEGELNGKKFIVTACVRKKEYATSYRWDEYTLFNPIHGYFYLSQYNGHWILFQELNQVFTKSGSYQSIYFDNELYNLYSKYHSVIVSAVGEFSYNLPLKGKTFVRELIAPPYVISTEETSTSITSFKGEHVNASAIKNAFQVEKMPSSSGVGMVELFISNFSEDALKRLLILLAILIGCIQIYFSLESKEELVFSSSYAVTDSTARKEIYTKSFKLNGELKNVEISLRTNVDNNWLYSAVTLINENTGEKFDVDLEASYYHGYESGESWSEGSSSVSTVVSSVPGGTYYLIIYPVKPENTIIDTFEVIVKRDVDIFSNFFIVILVLGAFPAFYFYRKQNFEKRRWYNSDYSPYEDD